MQYENPFAEEPPKLQNPPSHPAPQQQNAPAGSGAGTARWPLLLLALAVVVIVALLAAFFFLIPTGTSASTQNSTTQIVVTESVEPPSEEPAAPEQPTSAEQSAVAVSAGPPLPAYVTPVGDNIYTSGPTSSSFAHEVARQWRNDYGSLYTGDGPVRAYSPVTGSTYTMNCSNYQTYVHCQGGNDANVYLQ